MPPHPSYTYPTNKNYLLIIYLIIDKIKKLMEPKIVTENKTQIKVFLIHSILIISSMHTIVKDLNVFLFIFLKMVWIIEMTTATRHLDLL